MINKDLFSTKSEEEKFRSVLRQAFWVDSRLKVRAVPTIIGGGHYVKKWKEIGFLSDLGRDNSQLSHIYELKNVPDEFLLEVSVTSPTIRKEKKVESIDIRGIKSRAAYWFNEVKKIAQNDEERRLIVIEPVQKIAKILRISEDKSCTNLAVIVKRNLMRKLEGGTVILPSGSYNADRREIYEIKSRVEVVPIHVDSVIKLEELIEVITGLWGQILETQVENEKILAERHRRECEQHQEKVEQLEKMLDSSFLEDFSFLK